MPKGDPDKIESNPGITYREVVLGFEKDENTKPAICVIIGEDGRTKIWVNPFYQKNPHRAANMILGSADKMHNIAKLQESAKGVKH